MNEKPEARFAKAAWNLADECVKLETAYEQLRELLLDIRKDAQASHWHRDIDAAIRARGET